MTPRQVDELHPEEYEAMRAYAIRVQRAEQRAARKARRG
jgi:hypothetical protein